MSTKVKIRFSGSPQTFAGILRVEDDTALIAVSLDDHLDPVSQGLIVTDFAHHEIHEGNHFFYHDAIELDSTETQDYLLTVPNTTKRCHVIFEMEGSAITQFQLFEASDRNGTTPQTTFNSDRNNSKAAGLTIHKGTGGGSTDGTQIMIHKGGSASNQSKGPTEIRDENEIILRAGAKYLLRVTSGTNANLIGVSTYWYEHIDGDES